MQPFTIQSPTQLESLSSFPFHFFAFLPNSCYVSYVMSTNPSPTITISTVGSQAGGIRTYLRTTYLEPARRRGETFVTLMAGDIHKELGLRNRVPNVCQVMESKILEREAGVKVSSKQGPPSGRGTTFTVTYAVEKVAPQADGNSATPALGSAQSEALSLFYALRGIGKEMYAAEGGGEAWLRNERDSFYGPDKRKKML
jgi:hypothetical protein